MAHLASANQRVLQTRLHKIKSSSLVCNSYMLCVLLQHDKQFLGTHSHNELLSGLALPPKSAVFVHVSLCLPRCLAHRKRFLSLFAIVSVLRVGRRMFTRCLTILLQKLQCSASSEDRALGREDWELYIGVLELALTPELEQAGYVLACWLSQNNQNKVITILYFAQYFCRNKSSPVRTSHNNAFAARFFLSLDFAICLFPQFLTSMLPFFCSFVNTSHP